MIENVRLLDFVSHSDTELTFRPGVTIFVGRNGSGKSSIVDGITYAFYGKHTRSENQNLVRRGAARGYASVTFSVGTKRYTVERKLDRKGKLEGSVLRETTGDSKLQLAAGERKAFDESLTEEVSKIVGLDYQRMRVAAIIQQGELDSIVDLAPSKLKDLVNDLIGIESLGLAYESMRDVTASFRALVRKRYGYDDTDLGTINAQIAEESELFQSSDMELRELEGELASLRAREAALEEERARLEPLRAKSELLVGKVDALVGHVRHEVEGLQREASESGVVLEKGAASLKRAEEEERVTREAREARAEEERYETEKTDLAKNIAALEALQGRPSELLMLERKARRYLEVVGRATEIRDGANDLPVKLKELESQINALKEDRGKAEAYLETAKRLEFKGGICPLCGSTVDRISELFDREEILKHLAEYDAKATVLSHHKEETTQRLHRAISELTELNEATSFLSENSISGDSDIRRLELERSELSSRLARLPATKSAYTESVEEGRRLKAKASELDKESRDILDAKSFLAEHGIQGPDSLDRIRKARDELLVSIQSVPQEVESLSAVRDLDRLQVLAVDDYSKQLLAEIRDLSEATSGFAAERYEETVSELEGLQSEAIADKTGHVEACRARRDGAQRELADLRQASITVQRVAEFVSMLERVRDSVFHRDGPVSGSLRSWALKEIGSKATEYARLFDVGVSSISLAEKARDISIECYGPKGRVEVESLSGGEKVTIALALRFAMAYVMGGYKLDFIILDEPTVHLDDERKASLVEVISRLGRLDSPLKQMIIITHDEEIFENAEIEAVFRFEATPEGTRVSAQSDH